MTLLDHYLTAVGMNLPKGSDRGDILAELRGHLEANMDERVGELGQPLTEAQQEAVLAEFGDPFTVATRYGKSGRGFALGPFQLMGPGAFKVYAGVLLFALAVNVVIGAVQILVIGTPFGLLVRRLAITMAVLFVVFTVCFAGVDVFVRRHSKRQRGAPESWLFYTPYLKYVPRWFSASGLVLMSAVALAWGLWWGVWPQVPSLLLSPTVDALEISSSWQRFQSLLLALLAIGVAQRALSLVRPDWNWLPWVVRLVINVTCVALLFPMLEGAPFVVARDAAAASAETVELARRINEALPGLIRGFGVYWALNSLWIALVLSRHVVYRARNLRSRTAGAHASSPQE